MQPWLTRNVRLLSGVSLAQDAASELLYPIMPIVLTTMLGAPPAVVGAIEGIAEGAAALLKYWAGRLSDRFGRKPAIVAGYGLAALGKLVVAASVVWPTVLLGRVIDRVGKGMRGAPRDALLTAGVERDHLGRVFGFHRAADNLGAVIPAAFSVLLTFGVRETRTPRTFVTAPAADAVPLPRQVRSLAALLGVIALVNFPDAMLLLRLHEIGYSVTAVLLMYMLFNFAMTLIAYPAGMLADRLPKSSVYAIGLACFAIGYLGLGLFNSGPIIVFSFFIYGGFVGITDGVGKAWISGLTPPANRGHAQGLLQGLSGGAVLVAGIWAGLAWNLGAGEGTVPLLVSGTVTATAAVALFTSARKWELQK